MPFFAPAYIPGNRIFFYGAHADLEAALRRQMDEPSFPVGFSAFNATIEFVPLALPLPLPLVFDAVVLLPLVEWEYGFEDADELAAVVLEAGADFVVELELDE